MAKIKINIEVEEYFIKTAKTISKASQVYLNKKYVGKYMNLIPLHGINIEDIVEEKEGYFKISLESDVIFKKEAKARGRGAYCYLPFEYSGCIFLIFES